MINRKSESIKLLESIQTNLKEYSTEDEIVQLHNDIEDAESVKEIQGLIYSIKDAALEREVQLAYDQSIRDGDNLDELKGNVITTLEDNAEYDESSLKESKITDYISPEKLDLYIKSNPVLKDTLKDYRILDDMVIEVRTDMRISYYKSIINDDGDIELYLMSKSGNKLGDSFLLKEAETPEAMQKIADKQMPKGGYRYITTHGIGPRTLPKDVSVFKTEDISSGRIAMYISRPLTSEELKQYDIKPEWIQEDSSYRRYKVSFFVDTDSMNNMEIEEKVNELLKGSGLASTDETIDVEKIEDLEEDANNFGKAHISKNAKVLAYQVENMGGGTMAIFGKLDDGNYFAGNEDGLVIYDADIRPLYLGEDEVDDKEIEEFSNAHLVQDINAIDDRELYDMIINQTNYDKY